MRLLGIARKGINIFCGLVNLSLSSPAYENDMKKIHAAASIWYLCRKAIDEEKEDNVKNEKPLNLKV